MTTQKTIYLIRHGEKPPKGLDGEDPIGLSIKGVQRSEYLRQTFSRTSAYNIGHIFVPKYKPKGERKRAFWTVEKVAQDLGLTINSTISRDDADGLVDLIQGIYQDSSPGNILICWEHERLTDIVRRIWGVLGGIDIADPLVGPEYPSDHFDVIWTMSSPYLNNPTVSSENTPLDTHSNQPVPDMPGFKTPKPTDLRQRAA